MPTPGELHRAADDQLVREYLHTLVDSIPPCDDGAADH
jgi:hypothetical protein